MVRSRIFTEHELKMLKKFRKDHEKTPSIRSIMRHLRNDSKGKRNCEILLEQAQLAVNSFNEYEKLIKRKSKK